MTHILVLGGTAEASALASALAQAGVRATLSYAGRVARPRAQPVPVRISGFGGAGGLAAYLRAEGISHLVTATHPFAAKMAANAIAAARMAGVPHVALTRPPWVPGEGDAWQAVPDIPAAVAALAAPPQRIMLALGRMHVDAFFAQPQHRYLLRFVDAPDAPPRLPDHAIVVDRGPFHADGDTMLMRAHGIERIVCKNAGGDAAVAKLIAARRLGLPVVMIDRPAIPPRAEVGSVADALAWLGHAADRGV